jgi:hypothetical protein
MIRAEPGSEHAAYYGVNVFRYVSRRNVAVSLERASNLVLKSVREFHTCTKHGVYYNVMTHFWRYLVIDIVNPPWVVFAWFLLRYWI